jgi:hypothetical protein
LLWRLKTSKYFKLSASNVFLEPPNPDPSSVKPSAFGLVAVAPSFALNPGHCSLLQARHPFPDLKEQWTKSGDIFSILLILGGDVIQRAIAQLSGGPLPLTPVAFSFGWVACSVSSVLSAVGDGRLMPESDCPSIVVNAKSGHVRTNHSWVLGRLLRDWDFKKEWNGFALVVSVVRVSAAEKAGKPKLDRVWWSGLGIIVTQIVLAAVPEIKYGSWSVLVITVGGTLLCLAQAALPQWRKEKWACRDLAEESMKEGERKDKTVILTRGNGSPHAIVIISEGVGPDLEDLAGARDVESWSTTPCVLILAVLWVVLLLTAAGVKDNPWFLLLVGGLGMAENLYAAGCKRQPRAFGIYVEPVTTIMPEQRGNHPSNKVFAVLNATDEYTDLSFDRSSPNKTGLDQVGLSLLPVFLPGDLWPAEEEWKKSRTEFYKQNKIQREQAAREQAERG